MVLVDGNVLLYAVNNSMPRQASAKGWIEEALNRSDAVGFVWHVLLAFIRLATLRALFPIPLEADAALSLVDEWVGARPAVVVHPTTRHASVLRAFCMRAERRATWCRAHLAALCIEHGARMCSFDRGFNRFSGIRAFAPE